MISVADATTLGYEERFKQYVLRSAQAARRRIQTANHAPLTEVARDRALHVLDFALLLAAAWPATRDLLLVLAPKMEQAGHRDDWLPYLAEGVTRSQQCDDPPAEAELHLHMGHLHYLCSRFDLARQHLTASLRRFASLPDPCGQARAYNELAWLDHLEHRYPEATHHVEQALALLKDADPERAMSYRVQGMIAIGQRRWQEAEEFHRKALTLFEQQGDQRKIAWGMQNLAYALRGQKRFEEAIIYYQQAVKMLDQLADAHSLGIVKMNLGTIYYSLAKPPEALSHYQQAGLIFDRLYDKWNTAKISTGVGLSYLGLREYRQAENAFSSSIRLFAELQDDNLRLNATDGLVMVYLASRQYKQAIEVAEQALRELSSMASAPNYAYLLQSLTAHLAEAKRSQEPIIK